MDRRDRHGRGMRGPLAPPHIPIAATRLEEFGDLVADAVEHIDAHLRHEHEVSLERVRFVVEDFPLFAAGDEPAVVPFGRVEAASGPRPATVVVYRRTLELRSEDGDERAELVHDALVEQIADLLDMDADDVDPGYED